MFCYLLDHFRDDLVKECIAHGTKLIQAVADALFSLPSSEDASGPVVSLPPPTTKLPREKPVCFLCILYVDLLSIWQFPEIECT